MAEVPEDLDAELDVYLRRAGLSVPPDRRPGLMVAFTELRGQLQLLRNGRSAAAEPSNVFRLHRIAAR